MKTIPIQKQTINARTGDVLSTKTVQAAILPPGKGKCQECGIAHDPRQPHDQQSLAYAYSFYGKHRRWPTWADAMAHCDEQTRATWTKALEEKGVDVTGGAA